MTTYERPPTGGPSESLAETRPTIPLPAGTGTQDALLGVDLAIANADTWWWSCAMRALRWYASDGHVFDAYDLTLIGVPDPDSANRWGALFRAASTAGIIVPAGFTQSRRPGRAGGVCRVWVGAR